MDNEGKRTIPNTLCPFLERECPLGENIARLCWHRFQGEDEGLADENKSEADCFIADWMFSAGKYRYSEGI